MNALVAHPGDALVRVVQVVRNWFHQAEWLADIQMSATNALGAGHALNARLDAAIVHNLNGTNDLIRSFTQLQSELEAIGDQVAGRG